MYFAVFSFKEDIEFKLPPQSSYKVEPVHVSNSNHLIKYASLP